MLHSRQSRGPPVSGNGLAGVLPLSERVSQRATGSATAEQAATEEGALERAIAVHPTATKAGDFACGVQTGQHRTIRLQHAAFKVGLQSAERFARKDVQSHGDDRAGVRVENAVRRSDTREAVWFVVARCADRDDLLVLRVLVGDLAVSGDHFALDGFDIQQWLSVSAFIFAINVSKSRSTMKSTPWSMNFWTGPGTPLKAAS